MRHHPRFGGDSTALYGPIDDNQMVSLNLDGETLSLFGATNDAVLVRGSHDAVGYAGGRMLMLTDMGTGTSLAISGNTQLEVRDWAHDPTGVVRLPYETTVAVQSDNQGGTFITTGSGAIIHFADTVVPASQIVSSVPPQMAFVAPSPPPPAPAPAAATPANDPVLTDPGQSVTASGAAQGGTADNQAFVLANDNQTLNLFAATGNMIHVLGTADQVNLSFGVPGGSQSITDDGVGTRIVLDGNATVTLADFGADLTGSVLLMHHLEAPIFTPDGSGGTLLTCGGATVDFAGLANLNTAQVRVFSV
jgi:hypothetical protein